MSKFSSYKESQLLFESWRGHVNEEEGDVPPKELDEQAELPPKVSKVYNQLKSIKTQASPEDFAMALGALQSMGEGV